MGLSKGDFFSIDEYNLIDFGEWLGNAGVSDMISVENSFILFMFLLLFWICFLLLNWFFWVEK